METVAKRYTMRQLVLGDRDVVAGPSAEPVPASRDLLSFSLPG
jgi:hypothetical protein